MAINPRSPQTFLPSLDRSTGSLPWLNPRILLSRPPKLADYSIFPLRGGAVLLLYPWFDVQPKLPPTERHNCCMVIREGPPCIESAWIVVEESCRGWLHTTKNRPTERKLLPFVPSLSRIAGWHDGRERPRVPKHDPRQRLRHDRGAGGRRR